jgi:hypothetical protein
MGSWLSQNVELAALLVFFGFASGEYLRGRFLSTKSRRRRTWRKIRCSLGFHEPGPIRNELPDVLVQRCDYCDRAVHMFDVDKNGTHRRVR